MPSLERIEGRRQRLVGVFMEMTKHGADQLCIMAVVLFSVVQSPSTWRAEHHIKPWKPVGPVSLRRKTGHHLVEYYL